MDRQAAYGVVQRNAMSFLPSQGACPFKTFALEDQELLGRFARGDRGRVLPPPLPPAATWTRSFRRGVSARAPSAWSRDCSAEGAVAPERFPRAAGPCRHAGFRFSLGAKAPRSRGPGPVPPANAGRALLMAWAASKFSPRGTAVFHPRTLAGRAPCQAYRNTRTPRKGVVVHVPSALPAGLNWCVGWELMSTRNKQPPASAAVERVLRLDSRPSSHDRWQQSWAPRPRVPHGLSRETHRLA